MAGTPHSTKRAQLSPAPTPLDYRRSDMLDALRGAAMLWMTAFHFCFDLASQGWWTQDFYHDPFWTWQRTFILSLFLLCAGAGQALALAHTLAWGMFWRRWAQIALCAALVSLGSWWMFPGSYIYFGVLHAMAVMLVLVRLLAPLGRWGLCALAAALVALKFLAPWGHAMGWLGAAWNDKAWNWLGLIDRLPVTEDYVPLAPWLGVLLAGFVLVRWPAPWLARLLRRPLPQRARWLAVLGRWSLSYYLLHQPVLLGLLAALGWWLRG